MSIKQRLVQLEGAYASAKKSLDAINGSTISSEIDSSRDASLTQSSEDPQSSKTLTVDGQRTAPTGGHWQGEGEPPSVLNWRPEGTEVVPLPVSRWTSVSKNERLLNHLLILFWTWDHVLARIVHRELLLESLSTEAPGGSDFEFCSEFLINSILAISMVRIRF